MNATTGEDVKKRVQDFYDQVGWQEVSAGVYQNTLYEDLRPVSAEYIHHCHLRVKRHLKPDGKYLLDAGSGPIQYTEYLEYSRGYQARVCADISIVALKEARERIGDRQMGGHGLFLVADVANLPFTSNTFDGLISLHTIHHLPIEEHSQAYMELYRVLCPGSAGVVVNGWDSSPMMRFFTVPAKKVRQLRKRIAHRLSRRAVVQGIPNGNQPQRQPRGTYVSKNDAEWLTSEIGSRMPIDILVWRSVNVRFLKTYIHQALGGKWLLRLLYRFEERYPAFFGKYGQYPLIVIKKA